MRTCKIMLHTAVIFDCLSNQKRGLSQSMSITLNWPSGHHGGQLQRPSLGHSHRIWSDPALCQAKRGHPTLPLLPAPPLLHCLCKVMRPFISKTCLSVCPLPGNQDLWQDHLPREPFDSVSSGEHCKPLYGLKDIPNKSSTRVAKAQNKRHTVISSKPSTKQWQTCCCCMMSCCCCCIANCC